MRAPTTAAPAEAAAAGRGRAWRQTLRLTLVALAAYVGVRQLPTRLGDLHYTDFAAGEKGFLEFCEPGSPQFAPVDAVRSPVSLALNALEPLQQGQTGRVRARLTATSGKPIDEADLLVVHTRRLHLLVVSTDLDDYSHVHPEATGRPGEFEFSFFPRRGGTYRVFADFTPRATGRALYAGAALEVAAVPGTPWAGAGAPAGEDIRAELREVRTPARINEAARLILALRRGDGRPLELEELMGAPAHLVAFDQKCSGFAHLHPAPGDASKDTASASKAGEGGAERELSFVLQVPDPGTYRLWAQVKIDGSERFLPFDLTVVP